MTHDFRINVNNSSVFGARSGAVNVEGLITLSFLRLAAVAAAEPAGTVSEEGCDFTALHLA